MDAAHPIWRTPAVQEAVAAEQFGAVIRMTRTARKLSLVRAGELVGYSASTLSRIETGQRKLTDVRQLRRFADVLGIPPQLFGLTLPAGTAPAGAAVMPTAPAPTTVGETSREGGDDPVQRRELLVGLVGVTGTAVFGAAARPATARAAGVVQELQPQLTGEFAPVGVHILASRLAAARATFQACRYHELAGILPSVIATAPDQSR